MSLLLLLALAAQPVAQAGSAPPPGTRQIRIDISPAGQGIVKKYMGTRDPVIAQRLEQLRANAQALAALANAPRLDMVRLQALMRQQEALQTAIKRRGDDRTLAMLGELSEADRLKFVRSFRAALPTTNPAPPR